jgi:hypothetical protein
MPSLVFVVGVGRSGTSLLQSMLHAHPAICFAPETSFVRRLVATGRLDRVFRDDGAHGVASFLERDALVVRLGIKSAELRARVLALGDKFEAATLYRDLLSAYVVQRRPDAVYIGDKDPRSVEFLPFMRRRFPEAYVLHIVRDPRDVLASKKKAAWSRGRSALAHLFAHRVQLRMGREWGACLFGERYVELRYEDLIADPTEALTRVCAALGLPYETRMLEFTGASRELVAEDELDWKRETLGPLLSSNRDKWAGALTPWEAALADAVCGEALRAYGYARAQDPRAGARLGARVVAMAAALADPAYRRYRLWRQV